MSDADGPIVRARGLTRAFGARPVLRGVDLDLARGESLVLFGANGAGKSTLLRTLALLARPDAGSLELFGAPARRRDAKLRSRIGFSSHALALYETLSIEENLSLFAALHGAGAAEVEAALARFELGPRADDRVAELSRGWQQRTALARATLHRPELWLLDEPFVGLDGGASAALTRALAAHDGATLVVTHDVRRGLAGASRWALLSGGKIAESGRSAESDAETIERLLGRAAA